MVRQLIQTTQGAELANPLGERRVPGNFLHRNQYGLWFSDRCNYKCSYCCNNASPKAPKSEIELNPDALIQLFNQVEPGLIQVSGGEPTLWQDFADILAALPQHYWVILTNLTTIPDWIAHPNIKLLLPAYHEEFANADRFTAHLRQLKEMGKPTHVKLIVKPEQEYHQIPLWEKWNGLGIPTSLAPLEFSYWFKRQFLQDLVTQFRTSSLHNSRFFRRHAPANRFCIAGTSNFFQVNANGSIGRCSAISSLDAEKPFTSIQNALFNESATYCESPDCYCEWHHWGQVAPANDNSTWSDYVETGVWKIPTVEELCEFVLDMDWNPAGRTVERSKESLFDSSQLSESLQSRVKLQLARIELETA
jgi:hypothetical protein